MAIDPVTDIARIVALEYAVKLLLSRSYALVPDPIGAVMADRHRLKELFAAETLGGADPALSDHAIGEIEAAIDQLLAAAELQVRAAEARR